MYKIIYIIFFFSLLYIEKLKKFFENVSGKRFSKNHFPKKCFSKKLFLQKCFSKTFSKNVSESLSKKRVSKYFFYRNNPFLLQKIWIWKIIQIFSIGVIKILDEKVNFSIGISKIWMKKWIFSVGISKIWIPM